MVPSGPEIRCSSSWMISSGGRRPLGQLLGVLRHSPVVERRRRSARPWRASDAAEEHAGLAAPGQHRELVDGGDEEGGQLAVDLLVDDEDRQARPVVRAEVAGEVERSRRRPRRASSAWARASKLVWPELARRTTGSSSSGNGDGARRRRVVLVVGDLLCDLGAACWPWRCGRPRARRAKRTSPSRAGCSRRRSSSAQTSVAARPSWSSVSRRSV